jgi:hypothetical protein
MIRKTPQEKKALSYAKDCRNTYHANDKSSRKNIPLQKAKARRSYRKKVNAVVNELEKQTDIESIEILENKALGIKRSYWEKYSDEPLGKVVEIKLEIRESHAGNGKTARKKVREFVANLIIEVKQETDGRWIAKAKTSKNVVAVYGDTKDLAIERCKSLAGHIYMEELGAIKILTISDNYVSIQSY